MVPQEPLLPELVQTPERFAALVAQLKREPRLAVDTESNSLHAYRERVCLMQFSTSTRDVVLDVLAMENLSPLGAVFDDPHIEKIFHAAEYDLLCLRRDFGFVFNNIFDTMQAGRILGSKLAGLDRLIEEKFGVKLNKRLQKANWGARPLSPELLRYAALDTHYLISLRDSLEQELREKGLLELAHEDFHMACRPPFREDGDQTESPAWMRLSGRRDLTPQERTILKQLFEWRELVSAQLDRPPFKVLTDEKLIAIARAQPSAPEDLEGVIGEKARKQWGTDLLAAVARGVRQPPVQRRSVPPPNRAFLQRLDGLKAWRKKAAAAMDVESDVVLPRALLLELADKGAQDLESIMSPSPWRLQRFGEEISAVLQQVPS